MSRRPDRLGRYRLASVYRKIAYTMVKSLHLVQSMRQLKV